jgi:hypothetical protein
MAPETRFHIYGSRTPERAVESARFWIFQAGGYLKMGKLDLALNRAHHALDMLLVALLYPTKPSESK